MPFMGKFGPKNQNSNMQNSMTIFIFFLFLTENTFLGGRFGLKYQNYNMQNLQNSMVVFIFYVFDWE